jgi:hypothetical protein
VHFLCYQTIVPEGDAPSHPLGWGADRFGRMPQKAVADANRVFAAFCIRPDAIRFCVDVLLAATETVAAG